MAVTEFVLGVGIKRGGLRTAPCFSFVPSLSLSLVFVMAAVVPLTPASVKCDLFALTAPSTSPATPKRPVFRPRDYLPASPIVDRHGLSLTLIDYEDEEEDEDDDSFFFRGALFSEDDDEYMEEAVDAELDETDESELPILYALGPVYGRSLKAAPFGCWDWSDTEEEDEEEQLVPAKRRCID